jgi:1-acyl-sn-glycerol-3-phosphate acyltransferase
MLRWVFSKVMRIYFRRVDVVGDLPPPATQGRIFVANHVNGLVDPVLVMTSAPCVISPLGKSTLWSIPLLKWALGAIDAVPVTRRKDDPTKSAGSNDAVFEAVAGKLQRGGNILIFPEGISHNEPQLQRLRTGAARMLIRAADAGCKGLTFQAVGLEFDARDVFRSRALVIYGPLREVDAIAGSCEGGGSEEVVLAITQSMASDLSELIVEGTDWAEMRAIAQVAEVLANTLPLAPDAPLSSLERRNTMGRRVEMATRTIGKAHPGLASRIKCNLESYFSALERSGLSDRDVVRGALGVGALRAALLGLVLPLALVGVVIFALPYHLPRVVARVLAKESRDVVSTYKLGAGLVVVPLWVIGLTIAACVWIAMPWVLVACMLVWLSPWCALVWLDVLEHGPKRPANREELLKLRGELLSSIQQAQAAAAMN